MKHHLVLFHRPLVKNLGRDVLGLQVDALRFGLVQHVGKESHLELETQQIDLGDVLLPAFEDDFLHEQPRDGQVDRADDDHAARLLAVEDPQARRLFRLVGGEDQVKERGFLGLKLLLLFLFS